MIIALGFILPMCLAVYQPRFWGFMPNDSLSPYQRKILSRMFSTSLLQLLGWFQIAAFSLSGQSLLDNYKVIVLWGLLSYHRYHSQLGLKETAGESDRDRAGYLLAQFHLVSGRLPLYSLNGMVGTLPANFILYFLAGALTALGNLDSGTQPSNLLLILGLYTPMLTGFKRLIGTFLPSYRWRSGSDSLSKAMHSIF